MKRSWAFATGGHIRPDTRELHGGITASIRHGVVLLFDQHSGQLSGRHARDALGLIRGVAAVAAPVTNDGAVVATGLGGFALIEQRDVELLVEVLVIDATRQVVWMRLAPDLS